MEGELANLKCCLRIPFFSIGFKMSWDWNHFAIGILLRPEMKGIRYALHKQAMGIPFAQTR